MKLKKKITKVLATSMAFSMIFSSNAFATPIDLVNSTESVVTDTLTKTEGTDHFTDEDTNVWNNGEIVEEVRVSVQRESEFIITIPKDIVLDGETGKADYVVNAKGDIAGNQVLKVVPDAEFELAEAGGKDSVTATVTQEYTDYTYVEMQGDGTDYPGNVEVTLTAGEWAGKFAFNISFEGEELNSDDSSSSDTLPEAGQPLEAYSWAEIAAISEASEAINYFSVGDEKSVIINEYSYYDEYYKKTVTHPETTYTLQIIGFNHDDLTNGSGKAGITFGLKEVMTTGYGMTTTNNNIGGWENSVMRSYLRDKVFPNLPQDLQDIIKTVNKKTSAGDKSTEIVTSEDKLFLFSEIEVFNSNIHSANGEGEQYDYFIDNKNVIKLKPDNTASGWLERSPDINSIDYFACVDGDGDNIKAVTSIFIYGVVFGFCI